MVFAAETSFLESWYTEVGIRLRLPKSNHQECNQTQGEGITFQHRNPILDCNSSTRTSIRSHSSVEDEIALQLLYSDCHIIVFVLSNRISNARMSIGQTCFRLLQAQMLLQQVAGPKSIHQQKYSCLKELKSSLPAILANGDRLTVAVPLLLMGLTPVLMYFSSE